MKNPTTPEPIVPSISFGKGDGEGSPQNPAMMVQWPMFIRLPPRGRGKKCPYTGMTRSWYEAAVREKLFNSRVIQQPGKSRWIRIFPSVEVYNYLLGLPTEPTQPKGEKK